MDILSKPYPDGAWRESGGQGLGNQVFFVTSLKYSFLRIGLIIMLPNAFFYN